MDAGRGQKEALPRLGIRSFGGTANPETAVVESDTGQFCGEMPHPSAAEEPDLQGASRGIWRALENTMSGTSFARLMLLTWTTFAAAGASANLLGVNYSEWLAATTQMAT